MGDRRSVKISQVAWFKNFLNQFNGIVYYDTTPVQAGLHLDASLTGLGGIFDNQCYFLSILRGFNNYTIVHLEMLNIVANGLIKRYV